MAIQRFSELQHKRIILWLLCRRQQRRTEQLGRRERAAQFPAWGNMEIDDDDYAGIMPDDPDIGDIVTRRHEDMNFIFEW